MYDPDEENDSICPVFDKFYNDGRKGAIYSMAKFFPEKFEQIYSCIEEALKRAFNVGRGKRASVFLKDCFSMCLTMVKHGGTWDFLSRIFHCKGANFERPVL